MAKLVEFLDDLKQYLQESITTLDNNFSNLKVTYAYENENKPNPPEIKLMTFDDSEDTMTNSYESENITTVSCNIYAYANAMKFNGSEEKTNAVISTTILADDIKEVLKKINFNQNNSNIIASTRQTYTGAMAVKDTSYYMAVVVYEFKILNNYTKVYR